MNNIENRIVKNINSLVMMLRSKGVKQLSATKFLLFINKNYNVQLDQEALEELLSDNDSVLEIVDDKIMIGAPEETDKEESVGEDIHDIAVDQAAENMSMESVKLNDVLAIYENIKIGAEINPKNVILEETDKNYFLNNGVKKAKLSYIITDILPSSKIEESKVRCKVKGQFMIVDIPITSIK